MNLFRSEQLGIDAEMQANALAMLDNRSRPVTPKILQRPDTARSPEHKKSELCVRGLSHDMLTLV